MISVKSSFYFRLTRHQMYEKQLNAKDTLVAGILQNLAGSPTVATNAQHNFPLLTSSEVGSTTNDVLLKPGLSAANLFSPK